MKFTPQFLDELRARLPVSEVVGRRVKLRKAGREWKGLSPFNKEKTPSFTVNDEKGFYHDFSSGKHGSIFDFVMETEGVSFPEAVERLAEVAGIPLPAYSPEAEARDERRRTLHDIVELAAKFFEATLASRNGARGRGYLADRGLTSPTQLKFRLGYAAAGQYALKEHLGAAKVPVEDMIEAGLLVAGQDIAVPYDRFRDRVMFPIADWRGRVIAFGGRALEKDVSAKYLNSPETPLFHKGATLYNIAGARKAAHDGAPVIAVEGYVDVIAMVTAGYEGTVATLGTAPAAEQLCGQAYGARDRAGHRRLARPRFADQRDRRARAHAERHAAQCRHRHAAIVELDRKVANRDEVSQRFPLRKSQRQRAIPAAILGAGRDIGRRRHAGRGMRAPRRQAAIMRCRRALAIAAPARRRSRQPRR